MRGALTAWSRNTPIPSLSRLDPRRTFERKVVKNIFKLLIMLYPRRKSRPGKGAERRKEEAPLFRFPWKNFRNLFSASETAELWEISQLKFFIIFYDFCSNKRKTWKGWWEGGWTFAQIFLPNMSQLLWEVAKFRSREIRMKTFKWEFMELEWIFLQALINIYQKSVSGIRMNKFTDFHQIFGKPRGISKEFTSKTCENSNQKIFPRRFLFRSDVKLFWLRWKLTSQMFIIIGFRCSRRPKMSKGFKSYEATGRAENVDLTFSIETSSRPNFNLKPEYFMTFRNLASSATRYFPKLHKSLRALILISSTKHKEQCKS